MERDFREEDLCDTFGMALGRKGRSHSISCCRDGYEVGSQVQQERYESIFTLLVAKGRVVLDLAVGSCWNWGLGQNNNVGKKVIRDYIWDPELYEKVEGGKASMCILLQR